jgi:hypothetical protein
MARTHKSLEGKEILFTNLTWKNEPAIITGCNKDIGISIQRKADKETYLYCLLCPTSPNYPFKGEKDKIKRTNFRYKEVVKQLLRGYINTEELSAIPNFGLKAYYDSVPPNFCGFSQ